MKDITKLADLTPDAHNPNLGTRRGVALLERSIERNGLGRSILVDREGRIIAGNKTTERVADLTSLDVEIITVRTNGRQLVVVQREDLDLASETDPRARELAIADNRTAEVGLEWDANELLKASGPVDLSGYFLDPELAALFGEADDKGILPNPPDNTKRTPAPASEADPKSSDKAALKIEPERGAASADPADEDQRVTCPECGYAWELHDE